MHYYERKPDFFTYVIVKYIYKYDLLMEEFVKVVSTSHSDLFKLKLSCNDFFGLVENDYILQHVLLKELSLVCCISNKVLSFLRYWKKSRNLDALFRAEN